MLITKLANQGNMELLYLLLVVREQAAVQKERAVLMTTWYSQVV